MESGPPTAPSSPPRNLGPATSSPSSLGPPSPLEPGSIGFLQFWAPVPSFRDPGAPHQPALCQRSRCSGFPGQHSGRPGSLGTSPGRARCRRDTGGHSQYGCSGELGGGCKETLMKLSHPQSHNNPEEWRSWAPHLQEQKQVLEQGACPVLQRTLGTHIGWKRLVRPG